MSTQWNVHYRPQTVSSIHLTSVRKTVTGVLASPRFPHALLFAGPKGTGKTSVSRILAAMLNDQVNVEVVKEKVFPSSKKPVKNTKSFKDADASSPQIAAIFKGESFLVNELDAASNRGIDDIRRLKEMAVVPPMSGLVSVYILDEVHMLTTEAFNALLKLLEEPPAHVVFILATTELHKVPDTIVSRCQVIRFDKATTEEITSALSPIIKSEKLAISDEDLHTIANLADGSFRDAVKYLELQASLQGQTLSEALHAPNDLLCHHLIEAVIAKDEAQLLSLLATARKSGIHEQPFVKALIRVLHDDLLANYQLSKTTPHFSEKVSMFLLQTLSNPDLLKPSPLPLLRLELALLDIISRAKDRSLPKQNSPQPEKPPKNQHKTVAAFRSENEQSQDQNRSSKASTLLHSSTDDQSTRTELVIQPDVIPSASHEFSSVQTNSLSSTGGDGAIIVERWTELVDRASKHNFSLAALLRSATPISGKPGSTTIKVYYSFHKDQLFQPKWFRLLQDLIAELAGGFVQLTCVVEEPTKSELIEPAKTQSLERLAVEALM